MNFGINSRFSHAHCAPLEAVIAPAYNWNTKYILEFSVTTTPLIQNCWCYFF